MKAKRLQRNRWRAIPLLLMIWLSSCGGGGGGSSRFQSPNTLVTGDSLIEPPLDLNPSEPDSTPVDDDGVDYVFASREMRTLARPVMPASSLSETLIRCTVTTVNGEECNLRTLPLLGMVSVDPTVDEIMQRVLVSHDWMGTRFREVLETMPREIRLLTRGLTGIVISFDIRPSFYTTQTGAIYLDPDGLWLKLDEKEVVSSKPDYRSAFGDVLQFTMLWRYVLNQERANRPPTDRDRTVDDIKYRMASLLYHELAHANDFFPPGDYDQLDLTLPLWRTVARSTRPSNLLNGSLPLQSNLMHALARVSFFGESASDFQMQVSATDVASEFPNDQASDYYNYSTDREDLAMLFEELLMLFSFNVDRDVGVSNLPDERQCANFILAWGQRNRVLNPGIAARALFVADRVLPEFSDRLNDYIRDSSLPKVLPVGEDWCSAKNFESSNTEARSQRVLPSPDEQPVEMLVPYL